MVFACSFSCAEEQAYNSGLGDFGDWRFVMGVEDVAGHPIETIDFITCPHRWKPATRTAYNHMEHYLLEYHRGRL